MSDNGSEDTSNAKHTIPIHDPQRDSAPWLELMIERARAINKYAEVEQSLSGLFSQLVNTTPKIASIIFFRIVNTRARNTVVEQILRERHGSTYNLFWNSVDAFLQKIDQSRNEIVHWHLVHNLGTTPDGEIESSYHLTPPNFWALTADTPKHNATSLNEFSAKCDFIYRFINMFSLMLMGKLDGDAAKPWLGIFQQPITYPPPDTHPLFPNYEAPETPPPPSQA